MFPVQLLFPADYHTQAHTFQHKVALWMVFYHPQHCICFLKFLQDFLPNFEPHERNKLYEIERQVCACSRYIHPIRLYANCGVQKHLNYICFQIIKLNSPSLALLFIASLGFSFWSPALTKLIADFTFSAFLDTNRLGFSFSSCTAFAATRILQKLPVKFFFIFGQFFNRSRIQHRRCAFHVQNNKLVGITNIFAFLEFYLSF